METNTKTPTALATAAQATALEAVRAHAASMDVEGDQVLWPGARGRR